jgi:hypothetical protein
MPGGNDKKYMAKYRKNNLKYVERQRKIAKARRRAMEILAKAHPKEFEAIYAECRKEEGVVPYVQNH